MTSGKMNLIKNYKKVLILTFFLFSMHAHALETKNGLVELLQQFAQQQQSTADFTEEKRTSFLRKPIISSGYLQFIAPNKLYKIIQQPENVSQKITGNELEIKERNKTHTIDLTEHPEFSVILRSIMSLLSGDHAALKKDFKMAFNKVKSLWTLKLIPHDSYIASYVDSIEMSGNKDKLTKIIVNETNKDRSITFIKNHR